MQTAQYTRLWSELQTPRQVSGLITVICVKFLGLITGAEPSRSLRRSRTRQARTASRPWQRACAVFLPVMSDLQR